MARTGIEAAKGWIEMTTADAILAAGIMISVAIALAAVLRFVAWWFEFWYEDET